MTTMRTAARILALSTLLLAAGAHCAAAQDRPERSLKSDAITLNIPPLPLGKALTEFARQSGLQVVLYTKVGKGINSPSVVGSYTPDAALALMLENTDLRVQWMDGHTVAIHPKRVSAENVAAVAGESSAGTLSENNSFRLARIAADGLSDVAAVGQEESATSKDHPAAKDSAVQEIIVTARKREEKLLDVPASISVLTRGDIERKGLVHAEDYLRGMPAVNQVDGGAFGATIAIRGAETSLAFQNNTTGGTTATYFGETPTSASAGATGTNVDIKLVDIERVEVLKGPQGTAFGSSSMGGAVRQIPVAPKLDQFEGKVASSYSVTSGTGGDNYMFQAIGNVPLMRDRIAVRAVAYAFSDSGYYRNRAGSDLNFQSRIIGGAGRFATDEDEVGAARAVGGRVAALFQVSEDLSFKLNLLTQKNEVDGWPAETTGYYEQSTLQVAPEHVRRGQTGGFTDRDIRIANAVMEYDLKWADLLATYSYTDSSSAFVDPFTSLGVTWPVSTDRFFPHREHNGEIRLATRLNGAWNFLAGVYGEKYDDDYFIYDYIWYGDPAANLYGPNRAFGTLTRRLHAQQKAVFGEASWKFAPRFTLTGGVRAYDYDREQTYVTTGPFLTDASANSSAGASGSIFRANLSYKPADDAMLYAGWAQGFRLGALTVPLAPGRCDANGDGLVDGTSVPIESTGSTDADSVDSYEIGGKFAAFDRRLTIDAAVFRMDWSNLPIRVQPQGAVCIFLDNAGTARSEGAEFQANYQISDAWRIDFGGSYIHARLTEDVPAQGWHADDRLPGTPKVNANLGAQYAFELAGHAASVRADAIHIGSFYSAVGQREALKSGDYVKLDISARVAIDNLNIDLYVRNVTDEDAYTLRSPYATISPGSTIVQGYRMRPRTIGLQLGYSF